MVSGNVKLRSWARSSNDYRGVRSSLPESECNAANQGQDSQNLVVTESRI
jgi:hypothetical protein